MIFMCLVQQHLNSQAKKMYDQHLYRKELFDTMGRDDELVDTVKLHLREKIINKLKANQPATQPPTDATLLKKISNSLFLDYLSSNRYLHTMSVFAPESGSSRSQFSNEQLKSMFRIETEGCDSMLEAVLRQVMPKGRLHEKRTDSYAQTDDRECIQNLQNKLGNIEFEYKQKMAMGMKSVEESEQRFLKYKNELNKRYKEELDGETNRIRNYEIANIRMEEQQKNKIKMRDFEEELELAYKKKLDKLREREAEVIQRVTNKMKEVESYNYQARQKILRDMESVKAKEEELDRAKAALQQRQLNTIASQ